jgi:hypothetical protein
MTKAILEHAVEWYPKGDTDFDAFRRPEIEPAGTIGTISECDCTASPFDFHFYPDRLNGEVFFGVRDQDVEILDKAREHE